MSIAVREKFNPNHDPSSGRFSSFGGVSDVLGYSEASTKVKAELERVSDSFSNPRLSDEEKQKIYEWKTGNSTLLKDPEFISIVEKGIVTKDITVYRAGSTSSEKALEFTTREGWARDTAEAQDRPLIAIHLKAGDKALFVPYVTSHHLAEVGVMLPPSTMELRSKSPRLLLAKQLLSITTQAIKIKERLLKDQLRRAVVREVHQKQYDAAERDFTKAVEEFLRLQFKDAAGKLRKLAGKKGVKFNPNHDPSSGRFSSGGGSMAPDTGGGYGGGGGGGDFDIRIPEYTKEHLVSTVKDVFGRDVDYADIAQMAGAPSGSRIDFEVVTAATGDLAIRVDVKNEDLGISAVRKFYKDEDKIVLLNDGLTIDKDHRGSGLGTELFKRQVDNAAKNGVSEIRTVAGAGRGENGYYTWPRLGYDREMKESDWPWSKPPESLGKISRISDLMRTKEGREWWKTQGGTLKDMVFDLTDNSQSRRILDAYVEERTKRLGTSGKSAGVERRGGLATGQDLGRGGKEPTISAHQIFNPRDWDQPLIDTLFPVMMRISGEAAAAQMLMMGVDVAPKKKGVKFNPNHDNLGRFATGSGGARASLVSDIVEQTRKDGRERSFLVNVHGDVSDVLVGTATDENAGGEVGDPPHPNLDVEGSRLELVHTHPVSEGYTGLSTGDLANLHNHPGRSTITAVDMNGNEFSVSRTKDDYNALQQLWVRQRDIAGEEQWKIKDRLIDGTITRTEAQLLLKRVPLDIIKRLQDEGLVTYEEKLSIKSTHLLLTKTTATEWLLANADPWDLADTTFTTPLGSVSMGFMTEWPAWMSAELLNLVDDCFQQSFWQKINDTTLDGMDSYIRRALEEGISIRDIARDMREGGLDEYYHGRAKNIARTECLPGDTLVDGARVVAAYKRWYSGPWVEVITKAGRKFSGTPNHPVLTQRGWVGLGDLKESDDLICYNRGVENLCVSDEMNVDNPPPTISDIFDSLATIGVFERRRTTNVDFHGDGMDGYVNIFTPDGELSYGRFVPVEESGIERVLPEPYLNTVLLNAKCNTFPRGVGELRGFCVAANFPSSSSDGENDIPCVDPKVFGNRDGGLAAVVSGENLIGVGSKFGVTSKPCFHKQGPGLLEASHNHPGSFTRVLDNVRITEKHLGDLSSTQAGFVEIDHPLEVRFIESWSGHVFNLTTKDGYFSIANGVYTSNTGNALNGARASAMDRLAQEVPGLQMRRTWLSVLGETTRDDHANLDGVPADTDGLWYLGGMRIPWPAHYNLPPSQRCNCQCSILSGFGVSDTTAEQLINEYNERLAVEKATRKQEKFNPNHDSLGRFSTGGSGPLMAPDAGGGFGGGGGNSEERGGGRRFETYSEALHWMEENSADYRTLKANGELEAVEAYRDCGGPPATGWVNNAVRGKEPFTEKTKKEMEVLDSMLAKSEIKEDIVVHRGFSKKRFEELSQAAPGSIMEDPGYVSTSIFRKSAQAFAGKYNTESVVEIRVKKGQRALPLSDGIDPGGAHEVLLDRGARFRVEEKSEGRVVLTYLGGHQDG